MCAGLTVWLRAMVCDGVWVGVCGVHVQIVCGRVMRLECVSVCSVCQLDVFATETKGIVLWHPNAKFVL